MATAINREAWDALWEHIRDVGEDFECIITAACYGSVSDPDSRTVECERHGVILLEVPEEEEE